jgi:hypothetical protein
LLLVVGFIKIRITVFVTKKLTGKRARAYTGSYKGCSAARFTNADPTRYESNWYAYVNNDPVN